MEFKQNTTLDKILHELFIPYMERVPDVKKISDAMVDESIISSVNDIVNDHIAFRTMGVDNLGIKSFEKIFLHHGYIKKDYYFFENKKLDAYWYAPPHSKYPRIFISELRVKDLSENIQTLIKKYTDTVKKDPVDSIDLDDWKEVGEFFHKPLWPLPTASDYQQLLKESEYAAWVIYNRYYLNHYTISIHRLKEGYNDIEKFNDFLESIGIKLNDAGGKIKTSQDGLLRQSSTVAKMVDATFSDGTTLSISGSYVEFAERKVLPEFKDIPRDKIEAKHLREGFEAGNADKIFESTYTEQTKRK
ncbi:DUF1338 domain-containing protein [Abyssalbus ytuae]|uniref:2-oxoadipate dioxygenase/decarboxylase n=1 Tax=Abyssalbus ytuae TaxID=2926907 RepID=A0A9E6ZZ99_9FLAO|nr:DUF1338 domain-containing protein [Abyssalbus ytuae]UOB17917.1 DUF1338 domain-containing protein [Abyssalbus ytuae]